MVLLVCCTLWSYSENATNSQISLTLTPKRSTTQRPHAPNYSYIDCYYNNDAIYFSFPTDVEYMTITITEEKSGVQTTEVIYNEYDCVHLPSNGYSFYILCITNTNKNYDGILTLTD